MEEELKSKTYLLKMEATLFEILKQRAWERHMSIAQFIRVSIQKEIAAKGRPVKK